jgi:hypothetical protein
MKIRLIIIFTIFSMLACRSNNVKQDNPDGGNSINKFEILRIDSLNNIYLIYIERKDSIFKIASKKEMLCNCHSIKVGEFYNLKIVSVFLPEESNVKMRMSGVRVEGVIIPLEEDSIVRDLFKTKNLSGLCYIKN